jgi:two-component system CheB/CheR fusion protein
VLPALVERTGDAGVRAWSAGCSTGQEAYSLAAVLADVAGERALAEGRIRVYGTDVSQAAIRTARTGLYEDHLDPAVAAMPWARWLRVEGGRIQVDPRLRRALVFGTHDLLVHPPLGRLDIVLCRNTLMYFTHDAQLRVLAKLHFSLRDQGVLFSSRVDLPHLSRLFDVVSLHHRVVQRGGRVSRADAVRLASMHDGGAEASSEDWSSQEP